MSSNINNKINPRFLQKIEREVQQEYSQQLDNLRERPDYRDEFEYFLEVLELQIKPDKFKEKFKGPFIGTYCIQAPTELIHSMGFHPVKIYNGSLSVQRLSSAFMPTLACPFVKSCTGSFYRENSLEKLCDSLIVPTTCDWITKLPDIIKEEYNSVHIMELPRVKDTERGERRWLEEIYELKNHLESLSGQKFSRKNLLNSISLYMQAWKAFEKIIELRRTGNISGIWSMIILSAFMLDNVESWKRQTELFLENHIKPEKNDKPGVFLCGSPIVFPNLKIPEIIEEAGMSILADELCTSERVLKPVVTDETSEKGLLKALADRYHLACSCPTYITNDHRVKQIITAMKEHNIRGAVYHQLKGCHPYDIESFEFERQVKNNGFQFLKIETEYSREDKQNILTRLEAFKQTLIQEENNDNSWV